MQLHRLSAKVFLAPGSTVDAAKVSPMFHRWIRGNPVEGLLIDVADYTHVPDGPGVLLIGHQGDYAIDETDGKPGLLYVRKRDHAEGDLKAKLAQVLRHALTACREVEADEKVGLTFAKGSLEIAFLDRLRVPNTPASVEPLRAQVAAAISELLGTPATVTAKSADPRACVAFTVSLAGTPDAATLLKKLGT